MNEEILTKLKAPFPYESVETKIQVYTNDKVKGMVVFYLNARAVQKRLDEVLGSFNWANSYLMWQDKSQICGISIFNEERNEWVTKHDGAENSEIEAIKGGLADAFKRAAVLWGIGRYLYEIPGVWVEVEPQGKGFVVKKNRQSAVKTAYETAVKRIFGAVANQQSTNAQANQQQAVPQVPPAQTPTAPANEQNPANVVYPEKDYTIHSVKQSGKNSNLLELFDSNGEIISAHIKLDAEGIAVGSYLRNVRIVEKNGVYGLYNLITAYQPAA